MELTAKEPDIKKMQNLPVYDPADPNRKFSEKEEKYLREVRTYEFMNLKEPGVMQKFSYGNAANKYTFVLMHGGKYKLPRFIQRHLESKSTPIWEYRPNGKGQLEKVQAGRDSRFQLREVF